MADCACRSRSQMASKPPRSTLSRVGLSSSGDPGPAHECPLIISPGRKTGWSSPRPCYQAPLHIPAQTCYATWATTCPHLPNPGSCNRALCPQHSTHSNMAHKASVQHSGPSASSLRHPAHHRVLEGVVVQPERMGTAWGRSGEQTARPPGGRAPQTPPQTPGCRDRKRKRHRLPHRT